MSGASLVFAVLCFSALGMAGYSTYRWLRCIDKWCVAMRQRNDLVAAILSDGDVNSRAWVALTDQLYSTQDAVASVEVPS